MRDGYLRARRLAGRLVAAVHEPKGSIEAELMRPWIGAYGIRTILDVGANEGQFAKLARRVFPSSRILSFEPIDSCYELLRNALVGDDRFETFHCAVGEADGMATFHQNAFSPSSSLLEMRDSHRQIFPFTTQERIMQVPVRTLGGLLRERSLEEPILLKMDVQGYESRVVAGAPDTLSRCRAVLTELALQPLYEGEPLAHEMIALLVGLGFRIAGVADCLRRPTDGRPLQMDMIFERS
jgi:FkbM family methyltransferase